MDEKFQSMEEKMALSQQGNKDVYENLLSDLKIIIKSYLQGKIFAEQDVDDVVQDALIAVHKSLHTYDTNRPLKPWVIAITNNCFKNYLKKYYRTASRETHLIDEIINDFVKKNVTESDESTQLLDIVSSLPEKQRRIIELMKVEGYTAKEVGKKLGMSTSAVKVNAHRSYKLIRERFERENRNL